MDRHVDILAALDRTSLNSVVSSLALPPGAVQTSLTLDNATDCGVVLLAVDCICEEKKLIVVVGYGLLCGAGDSIVVL